MRYPVLAALALLAVTFGWSAGGKLRSRAAFHGFRESLPELLGLAPRRSATVASAVVAAEAVVAVVAVGAVVVGGPLAVTALSAGGLLLAALTVALASMVRRRVTVPCRCFGASQRPPGSAHVARNLVLLCLTVGGLTLAVTGGPPTRSAVAGVPLLAGVAVAVLLVYLDEIVDLARPPRIPGACLGPGREAR